MSAPGFQPSVYYTFETYLVTSIYSVMPLNMVAVQSLGYFKGKSNEA
jgi:hypothetical protein